MGTTVQRSAAAARWTALSLRPWSGLLRTTTMLSKCSVNTISVVTAASCIRSAWLRRRKLGESPAELPLRGREA